MAIQEPFNITREIVVRKEGGTLMNVSSANSGHYDVNQVRDNVIQNKPESLQNDENNVSKRFSWIGLAVAAVNSEYTGALLLECIRPKEKLFE